MPQDFIKRGDFFGARLILINGICYLQLPTRLDKDKMKDYSQLEERYQVGCLSSFLRSHNGRVSCGGG